jgi:hypothetical protein
VAHIAQREKEGMRPGGYGLLLARGTVDELLYSEIGNEVLLIKYVDLVVRPTDILSLGRRRLVSPERRIERCGDATRAPTRVPKWLGRRNPPLKHLAILATKR